MNVLRILTLLLLASLPLSAGQRQKFEHHHIPGEVAKLKPLGDWSPTNRINLSISLPLRNREELDALIQSQGDLASPNYHRWLTPEEFARRFGPTESDYAQVVEFAQTNGLTVKTHHHNRALVSVSGSVSNVNRTFGVKIKRYRHPKEARDFYSPDREPTSDCPVPLLGIEGLNNYAIPKPGAVPGNWPGTPTTGSGPGGGYIGTDFRHAYVPSSTLRGNGQSVALFEFDNYYPVDIANYCTAAGLTNIPTTIFAIDGTNWPPSSAEVEICLDIEMVISMAPGLDHIYVYEGSVSSTWSDVLNAIASDNLAKQVSCSWIIYAGSTDPGSDNALAQMAAQGQSFFTSSGDTDAYASVAPFPGDHPNTTCVGGTTLTMTGAGVDWSSEVVWNPVGGVGTGGGISTTYAIPYYQTNISMTLNHGSTTKHNLPDVAAVAANCYVTHGNGSSSIKGGTSASTPIWAGFCALLNQSLASVGQPSVGFINPVLYKIGSGSLYATTFHDVTSGNNGSSTKYPAVAGYDLCTGLGTPNGSALISAITPTVTSLFYEDFDSATPPALPSGWTSTNSGAQAVWVTSTTTNDTTPNAAFCLDYAGGGVSALYSPAITIGGTYKTNQLSFKALFSLEYGPGPVAYDGGLLEMNIGGTGWQNIINSGGKFVLGGYNGVINPNYYSPIANRPVWSGNSVGFMPVLINLPTNVAGHDIQLRWILGSDVSIGKPGWYIDTIGITNLVYSY